MDAFLSDKELHRVNPASEGSDLGANVTVTSTGAGSAVSPSAQVIKSCIIKPNPDNTGTVGIEINATADANSPLLDSTWTPFPFGNLEDFSFWFTAADDTVDIIWRS